MLQFIKKDSSKEAAWFLLENKWRQLFPCLCWATARTSSDQNNHPAPSFQCGHPNWCKGTSRCKETGSLKTISEPTTHSSIPEPKTYPEPPRCNWMDTKSTYPLNRKQQMRMKTTYLCHHPAQNCQCCSMCCCCYSRSSHPCRLAQHSQLGWKFCKKYKDGNFYSLSLSIFKATGFIQTITHLKESQKTVLSRGMPERHQPFQI